jgi:hypothetical protein
MRDYPEFLRFIPILGVYPIAADELFFNERVERKAAGSPGFAVNA